MDSILQEIEDKCDTIQSLKFQPPGIFTNAIISKPPITKLLKDAAAHEQALYRVSKSNRVGGIRKNERSKKSRELNEFDPEELKIERVDGKSIYIDASYDGFSVDESGGRRTAVKVPEIVKENITPSQSEIDSDPVSSPSKSSHNYNLIPESVLSSDNINALCVLLTQIIEKFPMLVNKEGFYEDINNYQQEFNQLQQEIKQLEEVVADQRSQLNYYNVNINASSPTKEHRVEEADDLEEIDIDELIRREELEIEQLEHELNEKTVRD